MKTREFEKIIAEELKTLSYSKKKYAFIKQLDENAIGVVGFGIASHRQPSTLFVNPSIGVFNKAVEEIYCQLTGYDSITTYQPTLGTNIGYIIPPFDSYKEWEISDNSNVNHVIADMIDEIKTYGFSFMETYKEPNEMLKCLEKRKYIIDASYKLPIMYYLLQYKDKALEYVEMVANKHKDKNNVDAEKYLRFAQKFRELLEEASK